MKIKDMFTGDRTIYSFEIFPPKRTYPIETIYQTLEALKDLSPDFISVTYGASGSAADSLTCKIASLIKNTYGIESIAHLTGIHNTKDDVRTILGELEENNIENILALRGDRNPENTVQGDFTYAGELVKFIKENGSFDVCAACYPEGHVECDSLDKDIDYLKRKVEDGADHLITQLFFDNELLYNFRDKACQKGIDVPIEAGIMPVVNTKQIKRMVTLCGASLPHKFVKVMQKYEGNPEALRDAGIAYAIDQIVDLISTDIDGIHLYTMNNPYIAEKITKSIKSLLKR